MLTSKGLNQWLSRACSGQPSASTQPQISCQELSLVERGEGRQATGVVACEAVWMYGTLVCTHALKMEGVKFVWGGTRVSKGCAMCPTVSPQGRVQVWVVFSRLRWGAVLGTCAVLSWC